MLVLYDCRYTRSTVDRCVHRWVWYKGCFETCARLKDFCVKNGDRFITLVHCEFHGCSASIEIIDKLIEFISAMLPDAEFILKEAYPCVGLVMCIIIIPQNLRENCC